MRKSHLVLLLILLLGGPTTAAAEGAAANDSEPAALPIASPAELGLSADRLQRIDRVMQAHVEEGHFAGAIGLIARRGKVAYQATWGHADREQ